MVCPLIKWLVSCSLDSGGPLPAFVTRHLGGCDSCREFASQAFAMEGRLSEDAQYVADPSRLIPAMSLAQRRPRWQPAVILAACLLIAIGQVALRRVELNRERRAAVARLTLPDLADESRVVTLMPEQYYTSEFDAMVADAGAALNHLLAFIPGDLSGQYE